MLVHIYNNVRFQEFPFSSGRGDFVLIIWTIIINSDMTIMPVISL